MPEPMLSIAPEDLERARKHAAAEDARARETVDQKERDRLVEAYEAGTLDDKAHEDMCELVSILSGALHGADVNALAAMRSASNGTTATVWAAALTIAAAIGKPVASVPENRPDFDLDKAFAGMPEVVAHCRAVSKRLKVSPDLAALTLLALGSGAAAARVEGEVCSTTDRFRFPISLMIAPEVRSGLGKSAMIRAMGGTVLKRWEAEIVEAARVRIGDLKIDNDLRKKERSGLLTQIAKPDGNTDVAALRARVRAIDVQLSQPDPILPTIRLQDATPPAFVLATQNTGFGIFVAGEGSVALRRFMEEGEIDALLAAYSGEDYMRKRVGEMGKAPVRHPDARAAALLMLQPGCLAPDTEERAILLKNLTERGFFARVLVARPRRYTEAEVLEMTDTVDDDDDLDEHDFATFSPEAIGLQHRIDAMIRWITQWHADTDPLKPEEPKVIRWTRKASMHALQYQDRRKASGELGGEWYGRPGCEEFAGRAGEQVMRLATVLRVLRAAYDATSGEPASGEVLVDFQDFETARDVFETYFAPQAIAAFDRSTPDPIGDDAEHVRKVLCPLGNCMLSELEHRLGRGWGKQHKNDKVTRLAAALEVLEARNLVVIERRKGPGGGKRIRLVSKLVAS